MGFFLNVGQMLIYCSPMVWSSLHARLIRSLYLIILYYVWILVNYFHALSEFCLVSFSLTRSCDRFISFALYRSRIMVHVLHVLDISLMRYWVFGYTDVPLAYNLRSNIYISHKVLRWSVSFQVFRGLFSAITICVSSPRLSLLMNTLNSLYSLRDCGLWSLCGNERSWPIT